MDPTALDPALTAFRRLLAEGAQGGQAKVDAVVALSQRTVWVATWTSLGDDYRTLVNSNGLSALPVFSGHDTLDAAARRFGWQSASGAVPHREVGAREVLRHAIAHNIEYVVVDIASDHALEMEKPEIEPLITRAARGDSEGPYAAVGRISSDMIRAVNAHSSAPPSPGARSAPAAVATPPRPPSTPAGPPASARPAPAPSVRPPQFAAETTRNSVPPPGPVSDSASADGPPVQVSPLQSEPNDALLQALSDTLRGYPEVEWAALCLASHGPAGPVPSVALRVDTAFRQRTVEIARKLRVAGEASGTPLGTVVLDDPAIMRRVRSDAYLFYPWKKR